MQHKKTISIVVLGALAAAITFGAVAFQSVFAATPTTDSTTTTPQTNLGWSIGRGHNGGYTSEDLANAFGITTDELDTAYQAATSAVLKQAVEDGLITQLQADQLTTDGSAFPFGNRWDSWLTENGIDFNTLLADELGISVGELQAAKQTAFYTNIDQAVTDGNLTLEKADLMKGRYALNNDSTFQSSMKSAYSNAVNAAVASGVITQAQADQILSNSTNLFTPELGGGGGRGGGHGHAGDWMNGNIPFTAP